MNSVQMHANASSRSMFLTIQVAMTQLLTSTLCIFQATLVTFASARLLMTLSLCIVLELTVLRELQTMPKKIIHLKLSMYLINTNVKLVLLLMLVHVHALRIIHAILTVQSCSQARHSRTHWSHANASLKPPST